MIAIRIISKISNFELPQFSFLLIINSKPEYKEEERFDSKWESQKIYATFG